MEVNQIRFSTDDYHYYDKIGEHSVFDAAHYSVQVWNYYYNDDESISRVKYSLKYDSAMVDLGEGIYSPGNGQDSRNRSAGILPQRLTTGDAVFFTLRFSDLKGNTQTYAYPITLLTKAPAAVTGLAATVTYGAVRLSWNKPADVPTTGSIYYTVYRGNERGYIVDGCN